MKVLLLTAALAFSAAGVAPGHEQEHKAKTMNVSRSIYIDRPIDSLWEISALEFGNIGHWSASLDHSEEGKGSHFEGAACTERVCTPNAKGLSETVERIIDFKPADYQFTYEIAQGLPGFVSYATNTWTHKAKGNGTELTMTAHMELKGLMGSIMGNVMKKKMGQLLYENLEELKFYSETGEVHPRKVKANEKLARKRK